LKSLSISALSFALAVAPAFAQTAAEIEKLRRQYGAFIVTTAMFVEQCHSRGIIDAGNVQNETIEMGQALGIVRNEYFFEDMRRGSNGEIFDLARAVWITLPIREDHCQMVLGEQRKVKISLAKQF